MRRVRIPVANLLNYEMKGENSYQIYIILSKNKKRLDYFIQLTDSLRPEAVFIYGA